MKIFKCLLSMVFAIAIYYLMASFSGEMSRIIFLQIDSVVFGMMIPYAIIYVISVIVIIYLYAKYVMKWSMQKMYLGKPLPKIKWCVAAVIMSVAICLVYFIFTNGTFYHENLELSDFVYAFGFTIVTSGLRSPIVEGVIFRGLLLSTLQETLGTKAALIVSNVLYVWVYLRSFYVEEQREVFLVIVILLLIGISLSLITLDTGSVWSSVAVHSLYNMLSGDNYILHIGIERNSRAIWNYVFESDNWMWTGFSAKVGIETRFPVGIGFLLLIVVALWSIRKRRGMAYEETESFTGGR